MRVEIWILREKRELWEEVVQNPSRISSQMRLLYFFYYNFLTFCCGEYEAIFHFSSLLRVWTRKRIRRSRSSTKIPHRITHWWLTHKFLRGKYWFGIDHLICKTIRYFLQSSFLLSLFIILRCYLILFGYTKNIQKRKKNTREAHEDGILKYYGGWFIADLFCIHIRWLIVL